MSSTAVRRPKLDEACAKAVDLAREAAEAESGEFGVGEHLGVRAEGDRLVTHTFACPHPGYVGWRWSVTVVRASRARGVTVDEVALLPAPEALSAPAWVPWVERLGPGDVTPGVLAPTAPEDPRLEPGFTGGELAADTDPAEASIARAIATEFGLGRERVLTQVGRDDAVERWSAGEGGADNDMTRQAPGACVDCGWFVRLQGILGRSFGVCANVWSDRDGQVVALDHGCGAHSDVPEPRAQVEGAPMWDTLTVDDADWADET